MQRKNDFSQDDSGLYHFHWKVGGTSVEDAANVAIEDHPGGPAWFWFNDIPAPIFMDDNPHKLVARWRQWKTAAEKHPKSELLQLLRGLTTTP